LTSFFELNIFDKTTNTHQYGKNYFFTFLSTIFFRQYKRTSSLSEYLKGDNWLDPDRTVYTYESNSRITIEYGLIWYRVNWVTDYKFEYTCYANGEAVAEKDFYLDTDVLGAEGLVEGELEPSLFISPSSC